MGSLFGGGKTTTSSSQSNSSSSSPWAPQATQISNLLTQAGSNYAQQAANGPYTGSYVASQNPYQAGAVANGFNNGGLINNSGNGQLSYGNGLLSASAPAFSQNAQGLFASSALTPNSGLMSALQGFGTGTGAGLSSALNSAGISGAGSIQSAQQQLARNAITGGTDQTGRLIGDATSYMGAAPVQAAINSTNAAIDSTLNEQTAPGLDRAAAAGGSLNSSRAGAAQAVAQGQAALAKGTADASIQNSAFGQGLSAALGSYESGLNSSNSAAAASGSLGNATALGTGGLQTSAANSGLGQGLNYGQVSFNNGLNANAQIGNGIAFGNTTLNSGASNLGVGSQLQGGAGASQFQSDQNGLTNQIDQYNARNNYGTGILGQYQGLIQGNYGQNVSGNSSGTTTQTQTSSPLSGLLGAGLTAASIYSGFGGIKGISNGISNAGIDLFGNSISAPVGAVFPGGIGYVPGVST